MWPPFGHKWASLQDAFSRRAWATWEDYVLGQRAFFARGFRSSTCFKCFLILSVGYGPNFRILEHFWRLSVRNFWSTFACIFLGCLHKKFVVLNSDEAVCHALIGAVFSENVLDIFAI